MGTWGFGSFDNDDAADWVYEFESGGAAAVASALRRVSQLGQDEQLDAPKAAVALAAAEIVAAAKADDPSRLSDEAREAFAAHRKSLIGAPDFATAQKVVERVIRRSELKDLWEEGEEGENWRQEVDGLLTRLR